MAITAIQYFPRNLTPVKADVLQDIPDPESAAFCEQMKATLWKVAICTAFVAATFFLTCGILTALSVITLAASTATQYLILGTISLALLKFPIDWAEAHQNRANHLYGIHATLKKFENFSEAQMAELLIKNQVNISQIPIDDLSSKPFKVLFAYYLNLLETNEHLNEKIKRADFPISLNNTFPTDIIYKYHFIRNGLKEVLGWKNKINAACLMQRMYKPNQQVDLESIGQMEIMPLGARYASLLQMGQASPYFIFKNQRPPIFYSEMEHVTVPQLQRRLF